MRKPSIWKHKKYKAREYKGTYGYDMKTGRVFILMGKDSKGKEHGVVFESHEAAKYAGWSKVR